MDFARIHELGQLPLFQLGDRTVTPATLLAFVAIVALTMLVSRLSQRAMGRAFAMRGIRDVGTLGVSNRLLHYVILIVGFSLAAQTLGVDLKGLFTAGAIFAVGLGFAMQSIAQNFVSGVILLIERSIKPGDVLSVEGDVVKVLEMGIRATIVQTRDGEDLIVPNSVLIQSTVKNYTLRESVFRVRMPVGVTYGSDMALVRRTLESVAKQMSQRWGSGDRQPQVVMTGFGDNSVLFDVAIWMSDPWGQRLALSEAHETAWVALKEAGVTIAFPQVDVHFDPGVVESLQTASRAVAGGSRAAGGEPGD